MLHLHFAPSLDMLLSELLSGVRDVWKDPFSPPDIIVPGPEVAKWLTMRLADGQGAENVSAQPFGCVANLRPKYIERFLWDYLQPGEYSLLDQDKVRQVICALLDEKCLAEDLFEPVKRYLSGPSGTTDPLKRVQLSARIAHQLLEYEYNRPGVWREGGRWIPPGIDGTWMSGKNHLEDNPDEPWQAELYRRMRRCFLDAAGKRAGVVEKWCTLPQLYRRYRDNAGKRLSPPEKNFIFMFGVTKISHFHRNLFVEISQLDGVEMQVYLSNPCAEFWEDVNTSRGSIRRSWARTSKNTGIPARAPDDYDKEELKDLAGLTLPEDHRLLELWGNAGKENIFLWCQDAQWDFDYRSPEKIERDDPPVSLLESLQVSLLRRETAMREPAAGWSPDGSLRILACPDRGREIEEIREQVLDMVKDGTITLLNQVVVYLSDPAEYIPHIQRVFGRFRRDDDGYIPFCILGASGKQTAYAQGMKTFLDILHTGFDRPRLFELLRNSIVQANRGIAVGWVPLWEQWADRLGIFRGYDREHRKKMGDSGGTLTDIHTFRLGIARLLLGELSKGPAVLDFRETGCGGTDQALEPVPVLPFRDYSTSDRRCLETFCATVESLYRDGIRLQEAMETGIDTALEILRELVHLWMGNVPDREVADAALERTTARAFYDGLAAISLQQTVAGRNQLPPDEFFSLLLGCLPDKTPASPAAWTGGITFAPLTPRMIVPHDVVFAAGLDDVLFPGSNDRPSWNLLSGKRIIGDTDPVRDNRFAFLEVLHAARKRLVLSYRARDMQKESELHPSSVVLELDDYLKKQETGAGPLELVQEIPWVVHESLEHLAKVGRVHGSWDHGKIELAEVAQKSPRDRAPYRRNLCRISAAAAPGTDEGPVPFRGLLKFFENPLDYHLSRTLDITLDEPPSTDDADEPRESGRLAITGMQDRVWKMLLAMVFTDDPAESVCDADTLEQVAVREIGELYALHRASGKAPEAMAGRMEQEYLHRWASVCGGPVLQLREWYPDHRFLENADLSKVPGCAASLPVDCSDGKNRTVECRFGAVLMPRDGSDSGSIAFIAFKSGGNAVDNPALWLAGALQWTWCRRAGNSRHIGLVLLRRCTKHTDPPDVDREVMVMDDPDADKLPIIETWLSGIISEMVVDRICDFLPFVEVKEFWNKTLTVQAIENNLNSYYSVYHPYESVFKLTDARLPESDDLLMDLATARYEPMLSKILIEEGAP
jgi:exonuclease V gamma subunit